MEKENGLPCPVCGNRMRPNHKDTTYLICKKCGVVKNTAFSSVGYEDSYFNEEYQRQYGCSYEDDFDKIYGFSCKRVKPINKLLKESTKRASRICDIGCALGFFLKACEDNLHATDFLKLEGVEISQYAAEYCEKRFGYKVYNGDFLQFESTEKYDVISAWYCVEHFENPFQIIEKIHSMLSSGGVLSLSLPSSFGPTMFINPEKWFKEHPVDHSYDFSPGSIKVLLRQIGFKKIYVRPASIHPQRVLSSKSLIFPLFRKLYTLFSQFSGFSDTIEVFATKA